nr:zinc finger BED domain-containing protein 1-like [Pelodiscus sinensis]|eukprot:XP_025038056.1 zinc finger BED domain-containing protein 1-like [Pelodiscus sinensis]
MFVQLKFQGFQWQRRHTPCSNVNRTESQNHVSSYRTEICPAAGSARCFLSCFLWTWRRVDPHPPRTAVPMPNRSRIPRTTWTRTTGPPAPRVDISIKVEREDEPQCTDSPDFVVAVRPQGYPGVPRGLVKTEACDQVDVLDSAERPATHGHSTGITHQTKLMAQSSNSSGLLNGKFTFKILPDGSLSKRTVLCSYCKAEFQYHRSTASLKYHLRAKHAFASGLSATDNPPPRQSTVTKFQDRDKPLDQTKYNTLTNAIARWIAIDCRPLDIVNDRGLREIIQIASSNQSYTLPSRGTIASRINDLYDNEKTAKLELLRNAPAVALTGDHWSSSSNQNYLGVTAHLIDTAWTLQSFAVTVIPTEERHYAEACAERFMDVAEEWNIQEKVTTVSTDSACNTVAATSRLSFEHMACVAHSLQRSITVALTDGGFENVLVKCRKLVGHFTHSPANGAELGVQQAANGQKQEPLVRDMSPRWNSTLAMIQSLLCNKAAVTSALALQKHRLSMPTDEEFEKLQKLETLLEPCRFVTELLGGELYVSCSVVLPAFCHIVQVMAVSDDDPAYVVRFKTTFTTDFTKRKEGTNLRFLKIATALDPRFKNLKCLPKSERDEVWNILSEVLEEQSPDAETRETEPPPKKLNLLLLASDSDDENEHGSIRTVLDRYRAEPAISTNACPLEWWSKREGAYESLAPLARKYLATPATAVPCERLFSLSGDVVNKKRAALSPTNVNKLVCLSDWLKNK